MSTEQNWNDPDTYPAIGDYIEVRLADGQLIRGEVATVTQETTGVEIAGPLAWPTDAAARGAPHRWWTWITLECSAADEQRTGWRHVSRPSANEPPTPMPSTPARYPTPTEVLARIEATRVQALDDLRANIRLALRSMQDYTTSLTMPHGTHRIDAELVVSELRAGDDPWDAELHWMCGPISFIDNPASLIIRVPEHHRTGAQQP